MILIAKAASGWPSKGEWAPRTYNGRATAALACPRCATTASLIEHLISADGVITPSVECDCCGFHESGLKLEGWAS